MPLPNRIMPFGDFIATPARGMLMGNRSGRLHDAECRLGARRWASKHWICCRLDFKDRHRAVWGEGYTELFFLDEVTAFAPGHRPCFERRCKDTLAFATLISGQTQRASAAAIEWLLHTDRLAGKAKHLHRCTLATLPDGAMIAHAGEAFAGRGAQLLSWTPAGYAQGMPRPSATEVDVLTLPGILAVLWQPVARRSGT